MRKKTSITDDIKKTSKKKIKEEKPNVDPKTLIPSGSTMLNLACSDSRLGAYVPGTIVNLVGDKSAGKTMIYHTMLAEIAGRKRFNNHRLIHRDVEEGVVWNVENLFGAKLANRLEDDVEIRTMEDFKKDLKSCLKDGQPFIYGLDSYDLLTTAEEDKKKDEGESGYSGAKKTKELGALLRSTVSEMKKTGSLLVIISQVRTNMDAGIFGKKFYRTGGKALDHACSHEIWVYRGAKLKREVKKRKRVIGVTAMPKVEKNRLTGKARDIEFPIYYDYGIDDIGCMVSWLIKEGFWKKKGNIYTATGIGVSGTKAELINKIEEKDLVKVLRKTTQSAWMEIEDSMKLNREKRFK